MNKELLKLGVEIVHHVLSVLCIVLYVVSLFVIDFNDQEIVNKVLCYGLLFALTAHRGVKE